VAALPLIGVPERSVAEEDISGMRGIDEKDCSMTSASRRLIGSYRQGSLHKADTNDRLMNISAGSRWQAACKSVAPRGYTTGFRQRLALAALTRDRASEVWRDVAPLITAPSHVLRSCDATRDIRTLRFLRKVEEAEPHSRASLTAPKRCTVRREMTRVDRANNRLAVAEATSLQIKAVLRFVRAISHTRNARKPRAGRPGAFARMLVAGTGFDHCRTRFRLSNGAIVGA